MQEIHTDSYTAPVATLLTLGQPEEYEPDAWLDYRAMGIGPDNIPDLIRLVTDVALLKSDGDNPETWGPVHAWRVLGQLHAEAAIEPLLTILDPLDADEWAIEELPQVMSMIGPVALPALAAYIADTSHLSSSRVTITTCLEYIGKNWPAARTQCIAILMHQLEQAAQNERELNGFLMLVLVNLKAREALSVMEQAFAADRVDISIVGDWDDVQVKFGLKSQKEVDKIHEQKRAERAAAGASSTQDNSWLFPYPLPEKTPRERSKKKAKNKIAKQSRKKNRKR